MIRAAVLLVAAMLRTDADVVIDDFESTAGWKTAPSDGVSLTVAEDAGLHGKSMRLDFDFHGHGGYAVIHKDLKLTVPANYEFSFSIRGQSPTNTLEFKLIDPSGDNVWWSNQPGFVFPSEWKHVSRKKRQITFAWGPLGGGSLKNVAAIEFAITAGSGGKGSVWLDDLKLTPLPPEGPYTLTTKITASTSIAGHSASMVLDGNKATSWRTGGGSTLDIDFLARREFGGIVIDWEPGSRPASYTVSTSANGTDFTPVYSGGKSTSSRDYLYLPESDARYVRLSTNGSSPIGLREITVEPLTWSSSMNDFLRSVSRDASLGNYPRYFTNKQSYWTVVGVSGDTHEALFDTRGMMETGKAQFSIEPFIRSNGKLTTWADVTSTPSDVNRDLPIPQATWSSSSPLQLTVTSYASGAQGSSVLFGSYRVRNRSSTAQSPTLYLALRPFQVNPPWQFLNTTGGFARVDSMWFDGQKIHVNADRVVLPVSHPVAFGAMTFQDGDLVAQLRAGQPPKKSKARDDLGTASGVLSYNLTLKPGADTTIYLAVPLHESLPACAGQSNGCTPQWAASQYQAAAATWTSDLSHVQIHLPKSASRITESIRSNLAYILINRDGPAIQPGSRSYERSWIRDGSLTSAALLRLGHYSEVRDFIDWFAGYQFPNGKIPCCVDARGSDPVPENDSHGEFIYLVAEYYRHTGDKAELEKMWPHISAAFTFMDSLRLSRKTPEFERPDKRAFYGLMPQSISHEGYSAKPMHSYWDDFFALRGYRDAAEIAKVLNKPELSRYTKARDEFTSDLRNSIVLAMKQHDIDYIPGAAELGDFDATSTTVGVNPAGELGGPLDSRIRQTFAKYYADFMKRQATGKWDGYVPYEWRTVGTFIRMGERKKALDLMPFFFEGQRPQAWHQWGEVVFNKVDTAAFIGDMPHTWAGSDFIRSALDMFAYERDIDSALVIAAGIPESWLREEQGVRVSGLSTHYGRLGYSMRANGSSIEMRFESGLRLPPGGIVIQLPITAKPRHLVVDGKAVAVEKEIKIMSVPSTVTIRY